MNFIAYLDQRSQFFWVAIGFALIGIVGLLDLQTGYEIEVSFFYLIPICLVAWFASRQLGIAASLASAIVWLITEKVDGRLYSHPAIFAWNALIVFGFFFTVAYLLSSFKKVLEHEKELACTDYLTGAVNSRLFFELLQMEINRSQRYKHPFTIAYIDIDNFKAVNDRLGHTAGDEVLCAVVGQARKHLRKADTIARLGGDEFAVLLPEIGQESAQVVLSKIRRAVFASTQQENLSITLSIGVLTYTLVAPHTTDEIIRMADDLMYAVKRSGKNAIQYAVYTE